MTDAEQYISITGLKLSRLWHAPVFWTYAARCMDQARRAPGNVLADARSFDGIHHTLSVWSNRQAMLDYLVLGRICRPCVFSRGSQTGAPGATHRITFQTGTKPAPTEKLTVSTCAAADPLP